jgi:uncharacterized protein DUF3631/CHC2-type zinc finger protein
MSDNIDEAKRRLPLPDLMVRLGLGEHARKSAQCPFHYDRHNSFSVWQTDNGHHCFKCHSGCGQGDEINFLALHRGLSPGDATKLFLEMAGVSDLGPVKAKPPAIRSEPSDKPQQPFDWQTCVDAFTDKQIAHVAKWRGFPPEFVREKRDAKQIGIYDGCIAFPIHNNGKIVGCHYREKGGKNWYYFPKGIKAAPLVLGEPVPGEPVHVFESYWDADAFMAVSGERPGIIVTRGSGNGPLVAGLIPASSTAYLWTQNDEPNPKTGKKAAEEWQATVCANTSAMVKLARIPEQFKDLNDWIRADSSAADLMKAIEAAETIREMLSPEKLFNDIKQFLSRFIVFSQPEHLDVVALWIFHTWVVDQFDFTPYIYLHSPVMRCGKTQVQKVVEPLVRNPLRTCNVSEAALYWEIEESHPTLLWDEIDSVFGNRKSAEANENKRALINAGYERGLKAIRMERGGSGGFHKVSFDPFCPKMLAGIGRLPDTIIDRSISILIHRRLKIQPCQKYRHRDRASAKPLHDALKAWAADPGPLKTLRSSQPQMPDCMSDRQEDIWEPLLVIADAIGGDVPRLAREAARGLCGNDDELGYGTTQLLAIKKIVGDRDRITSADLINGLWEADALPPRLMEDDEPNHKKIGHWLSKFIQSYGGKPARQLWFDDRNLRGYEAADLKQLFERYCPPDVT